MQDKILLRNYYFFYEIDLNAKSFINFLKGLS